MEIIPAYLCGEAIGYIKNLIAGKKLAGDLRKHVEILIERNSFIESDLTRLMTELPAEKELSLKREEARANAREAQLQAEKKAVAAAKKFDKFKQWQSTREKYQTDEATGLQVRKDTGGYYCPKCLSAEPPVEQPVPPTLELERYVKCIACGGDLPNRNWRDAAPIGRLARRGGPFEN